MGDYSLRSLLPRGTKIQQNGDRKITINLILVLDELASIIIKYIVYRIEHRSNYRVIKTIFNITVPKRAIEQRILFKNVLQNEIRNRITTALRIILVGGRVQQQIDRLIDIVLKAVYTLTLKARPSLYIKKQQIIDLIKLRQVYTHQRNWVKN